MCFTGEQTSVLESLVRYIGMAYWTHFVQALRPNSTVTWYAEYRQFVQWQSTKLSPVEACVVSLERVPNVNARHNWFLVSWIDWQEASVECWFLNFQYQWWCDRCQCLTDVVCVFGQQLISVLWDRFSIIWLLSSWFLTVPIIQINQLLTWLWHRVLWGTKLLPVTHVLVDAWVLTVKPVYQL